MKFCSWVASRKLHAEGILKICELYLETTLPCVAGVMGASPEENRGNHVEARIRLELSFGKKVALPAAGVGVTTVLIVLGILDVPAIQAQSNLLRRGS